MMIKKSVTVLLLFVHLLAAGCTVLVGKAVYDSGEFTRVYPETFDDSLAACIETLKSLNMTIVDHIPHGIETEIKAQWPDGTPVGVRVVMIARRITEISIRSGVVGFRERNVCEMIHESIAQRLNS